MAKKKRKRCKRIGPCGHRCERWQGHHGIHWFTVDRKSKEKIAWERGPYEWCCH